MKEEYPFPIVPMDDLAIERLRQKVVDEVLVVQPRRSVLDKKMMQDIVDMGFTLHICPELLYDSDWPAVSMNKLGDFKVLTRTGSSSSRRG